jgi:enoyl-CoA hydratase/carnithine racemase
MNSKPVLMERHGGQVNLTLNSPDKHNALGRASLDALQAVLRTLAGDDALRVVTITGAGGRTFCAGALLEDLDSGAISSADFQDTTDLIAALPVPVIAAINGNVFGGGVELALSCDFRIGIDTTRMRVPAARLGLCYPIRGIQRFVDKLGMSSAKRILLLAEEWDAQTMLRFGLLDTVLPAEQLAGHVAALADEVARLAPLSLRAMKYVIQGAGSGRLDVAAAHLLEARCAQSSDLREGFLAQRERRPARFSGQ